MKLHRATAIAHHIIEALRAHCEQIAVAGSVRRARPYPNDIDIVIVPRDREAIERRIRESCKILKSGPELVQASMTDNTQIDFWLARPSQKCGDLLNPEKTIPSNYGSVFLCRTGSVEHNIHLVNRAKHLGLRWHPHDGVMRGRSVIASESEEAIFAALQMDFVEPEEREA